MARYDIFGKTEGMRRQVQDLILTAYRKGYKDGELDEQDRKLEMLLKEKKGTWIGIDDEPCEVWECDKCGHIVEVDATLKLPNYCENCGAKMDGGDADELDY